MNRYQKEDRQDYQRDKSLAETIKREFPAWYQQMKPDVEKDLGRYRNALK